MTYFDGSRKSRALLQPTGDSFGRADGAFIRGVFVQSARRFRSDLLRLVDELAGGNLSSSGFALQAQRRVREIYLLVYSLGAQSVNPFHTVTHRDIQIVNRAISEEGPFLKQFARDIRGGFIVMDPTVRANLYLYSLRGVFELGRIEAIPGPFDWILGDTDHCLPCVRASVEGPYQREAFSGLGYPVLPGIPGSGDLCNGLTRCGCVLRLTNNRLLPNADLQERMRGLLAEIVHDD